MKGAVESIAADLAAKGLARRSPVAPARLGRLAPALLGLPDPDHPLRRLRFDVPVPDDQLPVVLPEDCVPDGSGNPLGKREDFLNVACPKAAASRRSAKPTPWTPSSIRPGTTRATPAPDSADRMVDETRNYWMPVDQYIGGIEHAILHLLYSRFWTKVMRDLRAWSILEAFSACSPRAWCSTMTFFRKPDGGKN